MAIEATWSVSLPLALVCLETASQTLFLNDKLMRMLFKEKSSSSSSCIKKHTVLCRWDRDIWFQKISASFLHAWFPHWGKCWVCGIRLCSVAWWMISFDISKQRVLSWGLRERFSLSRFDVLLIFSFVKPGDGASGVIGVKIPGEGLVEMTENVKKPTSNERYSFTSYHAVMWAKVGKTSLSHCHLIDWDDEICEQVDLILEPK